MSPFCKLRQRSLYVSNGNHADAPNLSTGFIVVAEDGARRPPGRYAVPVDQAAERIGISARDRSRQLGIVYVRITQRGLRALRSLRRLKIRRLPSRGTGGFEA